MNDFLNILTALYLQIKDLMWNSSGFSLLLFSFSITLSYIFWKNPIDNKFKKIKFIEDEENDITYCIGRKCKKMVIEKIVSGNIDKGKPFRFFADRKNNPKLKKAPESLKELRKLTYDLDKE